jgi:hypothetical protein
LNEDGALFDSRFDDTGPFRVSPESGGVSLESALRDFGPAAIDDLIPRVRALAASLDAAHRAGVVHGALHPSKVIVTDDRTSLIAGKSAHAPYAAPEVIDGHGSTALSDQYSLAAIAYEWLFGRPLSYHGDRPIEFRAMPGVDRPALSNAFTRALSSTPDDRFPSCIAFCDALAGAVVPELPLAGLDDFSAEDAIAPLALPVEPAPFDADREDAFLDQGEPQVDDVTLAAEREPHLDAIDPRLSEPPPAAVPGWNPAAAASVPAKGSMEPQRFGPVALFLALFVGAIAGFAAGYMARPRALQSGPPQTIATAGTENEVGKAPEVEPAPRAPAPKAPAPKALEAPQAPQAPKEAPKASVTVGRILVRSTPSGASVSVDGVARGVTPLALRDLNVGTRSVTIARRGYIPETRNVLITKARPARTLDVRLASASEPVASKPAGGGARPSTPATLGRPAASTGSLSIDSRPTGAAVSIDGKPSGVTPLAINDLAPGDYRILMTMPGYRSFAATVRVVAGERARAAASLTATEQE